MRINAKGLAMIKEFEGFPEGGRPYQDPVGIWTIGYGTTRIGGKPVGPKTPRLSERAASRLLQKQIDQTYGAAITRLNNSLKKKLNSNQASALISFVYNVGTGGVGADTQVGKALRAGNFRLAADHLLDWDKAGDEHLEGLTRRRKAERALFLTPVVSPRLAFYRTSEALWKRRHTYRQGRLLAAEKRMDKVGMAKWLRLRNEASKNLKRRRKQILGLSK